MAVLTLALGIGANTAIFSLVKAVLVRGLPVRAPQELVEVYTSESDGYPYSTSSYFAFTRIQELTEVFSGVVGSWPFGVRVDLGDRPTTANVEMISWDFFQVLGVPLALGRSFLPEEDETPGTHPVVILGYRTWDRDFGRDPEILGNTVRLKGIPFTVVGVAPASYTGTIPVLGTAFYTPLMMANEIMGGPPGSDQLSPLGSRSMFVKARLRPEVTVELANQALAALSRRLTEEHPRTTQDRAISALP